MSKIKRQGVIIIALFFIIVGVSFAGNLRTVEASPIPQQPTLPVPTPEQDMNMYVDIDGELFAIDKTVTVGDLGTAIVGLAILATLFIYVAYRIVVDKLP